MSWLTVRIHRSGGGYSFFLQGVHGPGFSYRHVAWRQPSSQSSLSMLSSRRATTSSPHLNATSATCGWEMVMLVVWNLAKTEKQLLIFLKPWLSLYSFHFRINAGKITCVLCLDLEEQRGVDRGETVKGEGTVLRSANNCHLCSCSAPPSMEHSDHCFPFRVVKQPDSQDKAEEFSTRRWGQGGGIANP